MSDLLQAGLRNRLLSSLSAEDFRLLEPGLEPIALLAGASVAEPNATCGWVLFPESGVASIVIQSGAGRRVAVGVFGRDGMGSTAIVLGATVTPHRVVVHVPGLGHRLAAAVLQAAMAHSPTLRACLLAYVQALFVQIAEITLVNACCTIEQRLAWWLLMVHDRVDGDDLPLTHELLATILGARRTGVTLATHMLQGRNVIRARRGAITVVDRAGLHRVAGLGRRVAGPEHDGPGAMGRDRALGFAGA